MQAVMPPPAPPAPSDARRPSLWPLAWRQLRRDWRAGELRLLMLAVALAVAALCAVAFLADRLDRGLKRDAGQLLGGDAVIASDQPTPPELTRLADSLGLQATTNASFPSMARAPEAQGGESRLVAVKAVAEGYPLRGQIRLREALAPGRSGRPARGEVWVDPAVAEGLGLKLGDTLLLGDAALKISALIDNEPDRGAGFMNLAPRVMLNQADLPATGLIQPASRVTYRYAVVGEAAPRFIQEAQARIEKANADGHGWRGVRLESLESGPPEMRQTLDRAGKFLRLVAMLSALLAAVAVALAARDFANRHLDDCAMLRVLGQSQRRIAWTFSLEFLLAGLVASGLGVALGLLVQQGFVSLLAGLIEVNLPAPSLIPALLGLALGLVLLMGFGLPPVLQLAAVPALRVIRRDVGPPQSGAVLATLLGLAGLAAILVALAGDARLGVITAAGFGGAALSFGLMAALCVMLLRRLVPLGADTPALPRWLLLATRQVAARPLLAITEVASLALGLLALALLVLLRTDLIDSWRQATPANAPNRFVINIQPDQAEAVRGALTQAGVRDLDWFPMIRGRLTAVNDQPVQAKRYADERAQRLVEREFNLSHSEALPSHNQLAAGHWTPGEADGVSVEEGLAQTLGLKLGDQLRFDIGGKTVQARITSLRKVEWSSMRVNFFVLFPWSQLGDVPATYISAFRSPTGLDLDRLLLRDFPNLTVFDVTARLAQIQGVLDQVIQAVQALFLFTLATGLVVLLAAVGSTRELRAREFGLMRALGARSRLLSQVQATELLGVGVLAGLLAGGVATALGAVLARQVFEFPWQPNLWIPLATAAAGGLLALLTGWWTLRDVLRRPVVQTLREAQRE